MERVILHVDMNCFYASVELLYHPELRGLPVAVGGREEERHGIILTASYEAKHQGVKTAMTLREAMEKCPELIILPPHYEKYVQFSRLARSIYEEYTCLVENFGIDEAWLDLTGCICLKDKTPMQVAREIRLRIKKELGITASVGISDNKIFAKLGSDYRKPDACTRIDRTNFREIAWPLPVGDLLLVGRATARKLRGRGIYTIGDLAQADPDYLQALLGKNGLLLHGFANGLDTTPVRSASMEQSIKSIGNGTTVPRNMETYEDVHIVLMMLSESVAERLREQGVKGRVVSVSLRSADLSVREHQTTLERYTNLATEICETSMNLVKEACFADETGRLYAYLRSVTVTVSELLDEKNVPQRQLSVFEPNDEPERKERLERTLDSLRGRFGFRCIRRARTILDSSLGDLNARQEHTVHPVGFFSAR